MQHLQHGWEIDAYGWRKDAPHPNGTGNVSAHTTWFCYHRAAGFLTQTLLGAEKGCNAYPYLSAARIDASLSCGDEKRSTPT
ncbi:hypothetical protein NDU88_007140 [Pleurodeles waltl]|uniref:Uncharacterized protein n=1 Tax=Pleurodeles waltl TaxID=8319 RepID=A0AAV7NX52_PLEWA|nr:hypothetical protein NDU88_007140 [Pleurodeles waltl]